MAARIDRLRADEELRLYRVMTIAMHGSESQRRDLVAELERRTRWSKADEPLVTIATNEDLAAFLSGATR